MKKLAVPLFLAACLLLTACGKAPDEPAAPTAEPTAAADPTAAPETLTPKPTAEPTPEPTAAPRFAVGDETVYVLCEGRSDGAKALSRWLRSEGKDAAESFIPDGLDTPMYTIRSAHRRRFPRRPTRPAMCALRQMRSFWKAAFSPRGSRRLKRRADTSPRSMPEMRPSLLPRLRRARPTCC